MDAPDPEQRELCPDGRCVGVIGEDGRCGICGLLRDGAPVAQQDAPVETTAPTEAETEALGEEFDPEARVLCWDETCVGVLRGDGRCGTCGRSPPLNAPL